MEGEPDLPGFTHPLPSPAPHHLVPSLCLLPSSHSLQWQGGGIGVREEAEDLVGHRGRGGWGLSNRLLAACWNHSPTRLTLEKPSQRCSPGLGVSPCACRARRQPRGSVLSATQQAPFSSRQPRRCDPAAAETGGATLQHAIR